MTSYVDALTTHSLRRQRPSMCKVVPLPDPLLFIMPTYIFGSMCSAYISGMQRVFAQPRHDAAHPSCQVAAMNKLSDKISVVQKDIALLERGKDVRYLGANLAIGDVFDAGKTSSEQNAKA